MSAVLCPLALEPLERERIWGGHALVTRYGKPGAVDAKIGESWECWDENRVLGGPYAGKTIAQLRTSLGRALTGSADPTMVFPLLTKLIDARHALSVQVHPDDTYAQRVERQPFGKTECWHILEAEARASIVLGWTRDTSRGEFIERTREGALEPLPRRVPVQAGDTFYLPAGILHAIGAGIILFEVQEASDLTYRVFDYNRIGPDGNPRALHIEKAADVLDYRASGAGRLQGLRYELDGLVRTTLVADSHFVVERVECTGDRHGLDLDGMPLVVMALAEPVELEAGGETLMLAPHATALIPAALEVLRVRAPGERGTLLAAAPPKDVEALARRFSRAAVSLSASTAFFAQF